MSRVRFEQIEVERRPDETVLDALLRTGQSPPFSCRNGACLACLQRCVVGDPGTASQRALRDDLRALGYFLPCRSRPDGDIEMAPPDAADLLVRAMVTRKEPLSPRVWRLQLEPHRILDYRAGQFVNVRRGDGLVRSYSLASTACDGGPLEIHVRRVPAGEMSRWLCDTLDVGDELDLQGPNGRCHYVPGSQDQDLLLVATGSGAGAIHGIAREALASGHRGRIRLYHGAHDVGGLYLDAAFRQLAEQNPRVSYVGCVSGDVVRATHAGGRAHRVAFSHAADLAGWHVFAVGHPEMVREVETAALRAGAQRSEIHADPFSYDARPDACEPTAATTRAASGASAQIAVGTGGAAHDDGPREADPEMWAALGDGARLFEILTDFYTRVFDDSVLAPYFRGVTRERLVGQVFSFMRDTFTGQHMYFGMRPRTGHHWMVISDEIFDHRERLMERCLRDHGLAEHLVQRWRRLEERFRGDIVKASPWKLVVNGTEMPLDGFGEEELLAGTMCDSCARAVEPGERVRYHLRLGLTYCPDCAFAGERRPTAMDVATHGAAAGA